MAAEVVAFRSILRWSNDWSQQDIAEFYRVESALVQAGLSLHTDRGLSDEGDPWFVFCRGDTGEVFLHFARIDGQYVVDGGPFQQVVRGANFAALVRDLLDKQPLTRARSRTEGNVFLHPAALLIALVGAAFFHSHDAKAAEAHPGGRHTDWRRQVILALTIGKADTAGYTLDTDQTTAILAGLTIGLDRPSNFALAAPHEVVSGVLAMNSFAGAAPPSLPVILSSVFHVTPVVHAALGAAVFGARISDAALKALQPIVTADRAVAPLELNVAPAHIAFWEPSLSVPTSDPLPLTIVHANAPIGPLLLNLEAAQVVQTAEASTNAVPSTVLLSAELSSVLTDLISRGEHPGASHVLAAVTPQAGPSADATPTADLAPAPQLGLTLPLDAAPVISTPAPVAPAAALVSTPSPAPVVVISTPPPAAAVITPSPALVVPLAPVNFDPHDPAVNAAVASFIGMIKTSEVAVVGQSIVIYDNAIMSPLPHGATIDSLTFNFTDGSSLSLLGTAAEIHALHWGLT